MQRDRGALTRAAAAHNIGYTGEKSPQFSEEPRRIHAITAVIVTRGPAQTRAPAETRGHTRGHDEVPGQEGPQAAGGRADGGAREGQSAEVDSGKVKAQIPSGTN